MLLVKRFPVFQTIVMSSFSGSNSSRRNLFSKLKAAQCFRNQLANATSSHTHNLNLHLHLSENLKLRLTYMNVSCNLRDSCPACHLLHVTFCHYKNYINQNITKCNKYNLFVQTHNTTITHNLLCKFISITV